MHSLSIVIPNLCFVSRKVFSEYFLSTFVSGTRLLSSEFVLAVSMVRSMLLKIMFALILLNVFLSLAISARPFIKEKVNTFADMNNRKSIINLLEIVKMLATGSNCAGNIADPNCWNYHKRWKKVAYSYCGSNQQEIKGCIQLLWIEPARDKRRSYAFIEASKPSAGTLVLKALCFCPVHLSIFVVYLFISV